MPEKEKGSDALLPEGAMAHIEVQLDWEQRQLDIEQSRIEQVDLAGVQTPPEA